MPGWVEAFIVIAAIALAVQTVVLLAVLAQIGALAKRFSQVISEFQAKINPIITHTTRIIENSEQRIASIMADASEMTRLARGEAQKVDRVFTELIERLDGQIGRIDQILTGTLEVIEEAGSKFRSAVWAPVHQASAVLKGFKVGLEVLRGHQRRRSDRESVHQDEELFI
jgi:predicted PurR-regulated permease PerM